MLLNHAEPLKLRRYATHVGVIVLIFVAILLTRVRLPQVYSEAGGGALRTSDSSGQMSPVGPMPPPQPLSFLSLTKAAVPRTTVLERPREAVMTYYVEPGDTLYGVAQKFGISGETVVWANEHDTNPDLLSIGQELIILPVSGVYHTVQQGDTVDSVAAKYHVEPSAITEFAANELAPPFQLTVGQKIIVPGGQKPYVPRTVYAYQGPVPGDATRGTGIFGWPASGMISQKFWGGHPGIDIARATGTPIFAADSGFVAVVGYDGSGYGNMIIIDHGNGFQTRYAHLDGFNVRQGQSVKKGQQIATMGTTGRATGPHLHFEVIKGGVPRNPLGILP